MKRLVILSLLTASTFASTFDAETYSTALKFAQVTHVSATQRASGNWCFDTSVRHNDQGWDHYADRWEVIDAQGNLLGFRQLGHPHDNEQPFTRSRCQIEIPSTISTVIVRAKCNVHGFGGKPVVVELNGGQSDVYSVNRKQ